METFKTHRFEKNLKEKEYVDEFLRKFNTHNNIDLIVFGHGSESMCPKQYLTDREKMIVLSTIQWLGSPVGDCFVKSIINNNDNK